MWTIKPVPFGVLIVAPDGRDIFLQGDDASLAFEELAYCETEQQEQDILGQYSVLLEA